MPLLSRLHIRHQFYRSMTSAIFENAPEQRTPVDLVIRGTIPSWLSGVLYRTGPGTTRVQLNADTSEPKNLDIQHWFDGLAMHHRFEIFPGGTRVAYRSRKGAEDLEKRIASEGKFSTYSFGQLPDPCQSIFRKFFTVFKALREGGQQAEPPTPSSANVGVTLTPGMPGIKLSALPKTDSPSPGYLVAKTDADVLQVVDAESLEPLRLVSYKSIDPRLDGQLSAAHGCRDKESGEFFNYSCKLGGRFPVYKVFRISAGGEVDVLAEIKDAPASYIHSFAMTERYVVLCVWQAHITHYGLSVVWNMNIAQSINQTFDPKNDTLFYVIDRKNGGIVAKYKTPPFFCFHHLNAYDDPKTDDIVIDMAVYPNASVINLFRYDALRNTDDISTHMQMGRARRFRLPRVSDQTDTRTKPKDALVEFTLPQNCSVELPTVHPALYHKPYRYVYGIGKVDDGTYNAFTDAIIKLDMSAAASDSSPHKIWHSPNHTPSEPIFVPRPTAVGEADMESREDDGVLLSVVLDSTKGRSALVVLDAKDMKELARAEMETVYPVGFHGVWNGKERDVRL